MFGTEKQKEYSIDLLINVQSIVDIFKNVIRDLGDKSITVLDNITLHTDSAGEIINILKELDDAIIQFYKVKYDLYGNPQSERDVQELINLKKNIYDRLNSYNQVLAWRKI